MVELRKLSVNDGMDIYEMLQEIPLEENNMHNNAHGLSYDEYKNFLIKKDTEANQTGLIDGWKVPSTRYYLYVDGRPVGFCDLRHFLTDALRNAGGHIGYSVRPSERGKGYGKEMLRLLLIEAKHMEIEKVLVTALSDNIASINTAKANGGVLLNEQDGRVYIWIPLLDYSEVKL